MSDIDYNSTDENDSLLMETETDPPVSETVPSAHTTHAAPANTSSLDNILAAIQSLSQRLDSLENCKSAPDKTIKGKAENKD
mgnify:CR=1 FL=1